MARVACSRGRGFSLNRTVISLAVLITVCVAAFFVYRAKFAGGGFNGSVMFVNTGEGTLRVAAIRPDTGAELSVVNLVGGQSAAGTIEIGCVIEVALVPKVPGGSARWRVDAAYKSIEVRELKGAMEVSGEGLRVTELQPQ